MWKKWKSSFLDLQFWQAISWNLCELRTSVSGYSTGYNQHFTILHYLWLRVKSKQFKRVKNVKKWKISCLGIPNSTSDFSDPIWTRDCRVGLFNSLQSVSDDFALKSKLTNFTQSHGFLKRIINIENPITFWTIYVVKFFNASFSNSLKKRSNLKTNVKMGSWGHLHRNKWSQNFFQCGIDAWAWKV